MLQPKTIAQAMLTKLKAEVSGVFYVEEVEAQTTTFEEFLLKVQLPSIAVGFLGKDYDTADESGELLKLTTSFAVIVIHSDIRGYVMALNETDGIDDILAACEASLTGQTLGLALASGFRPVSARPLVSVPGRVAWQMIWEVDYFN